MFVGDKFVIVNWDENLKHNHGIAVEPDCPYKPNEVYTIKIIGIEGPHGDIEVYTEEVHSWYVPMKHIKLLYMSQLIDNSIEFINKKLKEVKSKGI